MTAIVRSRRGGLAGVGVAAAFAAAAATALGAALAKAAGVDFEVPDGGAAIPVPGFAVVTGFFSLVGVVLALAFRRWSARPAAWFVRTTLVLTAISLVPPIVSGGSAATVVALVVLHLLPAAIVISALGGWLKSAPNRA